MLGEAARHNLLKKKYISETVYERNSEEVLSTATGNIRIPMAGELESLNAAVSAAIVMYETARQRR